jgi:hypothetical protein
MHVENDVRANYEIILKSIEEPPAASQAQMLAGFPMQQNSGIVLGHDIGSPQIIGGFTPPPAASGLFSGING